MGSSSIPTKRKSKSRKPWRRGREQYFVQYLSFGVCPTISILAFFVCYALVLACLLPILNTQPSSSEMNHPFEGAYIPHAPGQERIAEAASALRSQWQKVRKGHGVTDESLLNSAKAEFEVLRAKKRDQPVKIVPIDEDKEHVGLRSTKRTGFVVLGMHRSGTSMLSGLLVTGMGYNVGGPLIGAHFDNEKGFFERIDVVLQNDEFLDAQHMWWSGSVLNYDADKALQQKQSGKVTFKEGTKGLRFLNDPSNAPWLQKDPRMCITLPTWLKLLKTEPAVVFTYRHPLEVAMSLKKREKNFTLEHGLRLWIVYNMRAVQNSEGLCRVLSSNDAILIDPLAEVQRISDELTSKCGVPSPPQRIEKEDVNKFVDPNLQHNKKKREKADKEKRVLKDFGNGCDARDFESDFQENSPNHKSEVGMYLKAMKIYCDFISGDAYQGGYEWPSLE
jgi:hypothetical protein